MGVTEITPSMLAPLRGEKRWAYLTREKTIRIASVNDDGTVYLSPTWYVVDGERIFLPIDAANRHGVNAEAGRALSALVDGGDEFATVHGVRIHGTLAEVTEAETVERLEQLVFDKYFYVGHPYADNYFEMRQAAGRRYFELVPEKMAGWDQREVTQLPNPESRVLPDVVQDRRVSGESNGR